MSEDIIHRVVSDLGPLAPVEGESTRWTLTERMAHYRIPGVAIAVIEDGRVAWSDGFGRIEAARPEPVTCDTLFQACSMSKPVAALAVMRYVERGLLDLHRPVNDYLKSWHVPTSEFGRSQSVTLARLLSHTGGMSVPGFPGYTRGTQLPTTLQVLDGLAPANTPAVRILNEPGKAEAYSGGGTTIVQRVLEELSDLPFVKLLADEVLQPMGMSKSSFAVELPEEMTAQAAVGHRPDGQMVPGRWHSYPELAAAGLWTTAADYATFLIGMQQALLGSAGSIVSPSTAREMMTRQPNSNFGLGFEISGEGSATRFGHSGGNAGFRCDSRAYCTGGKGAVVLTSGEGVDNGGWTLTQEVMGAIARAYDWPGFLRAPRRRVRLSSAALQSLVGDYEVGSGEAAVSIRVTLEDGALVSRFANMAPRQLIPVSEVEFVSESSPFDIRFRLGDDGDAVGIDIVDNTSIVFAAHRKK